MELISDGRISYALFVTKVVADSYVGIFFIMP